MDIDEREIFNFLKTYGIDYVAAREICRRAGGKKRYHEDHEWAKPILLRMVERKILETNSEGQYRVKGEKKKKEARWVSPDIAKILKENGMEVDSPGDNEIASDDYYEQL
jgi:adenine specific DNA methylase Mod